MSKSPKSILIITGVVLLLCLPALALTAGLIAYYLPRQYFSKSTVEVRCNRADFSREFEAAALPFRGSAETLDVRQTDLVEIGVYDSNPQQAADRANFIATRLQERLKNAIPTAYPRIFEGVPPVMALRRPLAIKIWQKAQPALTPARPNVSAIMFFSIGGGAILAFLGVILLIIGFVSGRSYCSVSPRFAVPS